MRRNTQRLMLAVVIPTVLALLPALADAQGRPQGGGGGARPSGGGAVPSGGQSAGARPPAGGAGHPGGQPQGGHYGGPPPRGGYYGGRGYVGGYYGYYGYYGYPYWGLGWGWGWGYPYAYGPWGYPYWGGYYDPSPEVRLEIKPKEAQVYVDGYFAGVVDDFDGTFQRLRMRPGNHELTLYLKGYRTVTQNIHLGNGQDSKIKYLMEPLGPGEANEPPPQPKNPPEEDVDAQPGMPPRQAQAPRPPVGQPSGEEGGVQLGQGFGALVIRVQPSGAEVLVDGERWQGPEGAERLVIQVSEGSHRVEVRKEGFVPFSTTVQVRRGDTAPLNVSLPPRGESPETLR
jgi:hypothetical protein